jgi:hypothetical protein
MNSTALRVLTIRAAVLPLLSDFVEYAGRAESPPRADHDDVSRTRIALLEGRPDWERPVWNGIL